MRTNTEIEFDGLAETKDGFEKAGSSNINAFDLFKAARLDAGNKSSIRDSHLPVMPALEIAGDNKASTGTQKNSEAKSTDNSKAMPAERQNQKEQEIKTESGQKDEKKQEKNEKPAVRVLRHFGEGLANGLVLKPINGITQLMNHLLGTRIKKIEFKDEKELEKSIAGKVGQFAGDALNFAGLGKVVKLGTAGGKLLDLAAAGAIKGGVLTPSEDEKFWEKRFVAATTGAVDKAKSSNRIEIAAETARNMKESLDKNEEEKKKQETKLV